MKEFMCSDFFFYSWIHNASYLHNMVESFYISNSNWTYKEFPLDGITSKFHCLSIDIENGKIKWWNFLCQKSIKDEQSTVEDTFTLVPMHHHKFIVTCKDLSI